MNINFSARKNEKKYAQVKTSSCHDGRNIAQSLDDSIKTHYAQDLGWRVFSNDDGYTVERAVRVNKFMEIHYRWRVDGHGAIQPANEITQALCKS